MSERNAVSNLSSLQITFPLTLETEKVTNGRELFRNPSLAKEHIFPSLLVQLTEQTEWIDLKINVLLFNPCTQASKIKKEE